MYLPYIEWRKHYFSPTPEELSYPKNQKMCDPILVTLLKMRANSQSSRKNVTPSSGTSPLASYKEVPPRGGTQRQFPPKYTENTF